MSTKAHLLSNSYARCKLPDKSYNIYIILAIIAVVMYTLSLIFNI